MTNTDNVTSITDKQSQPSCRFSIQATLDGYPIEVQGEGRAGDLKTIVDRLKAIGAMPPHAASKQANAAGTPSCPEHGKAKESKRPGTYYCPTALPDGGYCNWSGKS